MERVTDQEVVKVSEARIRQPCGVSVCRTREHKLDTRQIRVQYAMWRIIDHIIGQRLRTRLVQGSDTA